MPDGRTEQGWEREAIAAHARGDLEAERVALDALAIIEASERSHVRAHHGGSMF